MLAGNAPTLGATLTTPNDPRIRFADLNGNGWWDVGEPAIYDVDDDYVYTQGTDTMLVGAEPPDGTGLIDLLPFHKFYDADSDGVWDVGEPAIQDSGLDGFYNLGRYWDIFPRKIKVGEEPTVTVDGKLTFYEADCHLYLETQKLGWLLVPFSTDSMYPLQHGNEVHDPNMLAYFLPLGNYYTPGDISVGSGSPVTLASVSASSNRWNIPFFSFNFRPAIGNTANRILSVWLEAGSPVAQHTAKFPVTVILGEEKRPFFFSLAARSLDDLSYWQSMGVQAPTIFLKAQTNAETVVVSDRYGFVQQVGPT